MQSQKENKTEFEYKLNMKEIFNQWKDFFVHIKNDDGNDNGDEIRWDFRAAPLMLKIKK